MRIVYIIQYFKLPSSSGSSRGYSIARRLAARGHDVHVVTSTTEANEITQEVEDFTVHKVSAPYSHLMSYRQRIEAFLAFAARASKKARALRGDVVFATSTPLTTAIPGMWATILRKSPLVFEVRDLWPDAPIVMGALNNRAARTLARALEMTIYRYATHIVALSPDMKNSIESKGILSKKITVIPNIADNALFDNAADLLPSFREQHSWLGNRKLVLYCGSLGRVNGAAYIARLAAATMKLDDSIRFLIVGRGNNKEVVRATAQELKVYEKNFFMMESVPKVEIPNIYAAADLSLSTVAPLPVLSANSANKVFDTFASGTPLAINHEGWLAELLRSEGAGIVLSATDPNRSAEQLVRFFNSPETVQRAAENAKRLGVEKFDAIKLTNQVADVLEEAYHGRISARVEKSLY